jgi:hypothetical protein
MKRGVRAFGGCCGVDIRRNDEQRHGFLMSLRHGGDDIRCSAAGGHQTNRRLFGCPRVAERHISCATLMLRIDEFHVRPSCDRVADRKRGMREYAKNIDHASRAKIFD